MVDQINHHLYRKRGFYYFSRRVPKALLDDYPKPRIVLALKTRHYRDALRQSQILSKRLDDQWFQMQLDAMGLDNVQAKVFQPAKATAPLMSEATVFYLRLKGDGKDIVFIRAAQRNANVVIEALGDKPINEYASSEAGKLRDTLLALKAWLLRPSRECLALLKPSLIWLWRSMVLKDVIHSLAFICLMRCKRKGNQYRWVPLDASSVIALRLMMRCAGCLPLSVILGCVYQRLLDCIKMTSSLMPLCHI